MTRSGLAFAAATAAAVLVAGGIGIAAVVGGHESDPLTTSSIPTESVGPTPPKPDGQPTDPLTGGR
jgi:hypothetical protein